MILIKFGDFLEKFVRPAHVIRSW